MSKNDRTLHQLPEIPYGKKPAVLLVGNGINLPFDGAKSTQSIILDEWKSHKGGDAPAALWKLPFPMQVVAATNDSVQGCMKNIAEVFKAQENTDEQNDLLSSVIDVGFDAILSTNYSLEFERLAIADFSPGKVYARYRTAKNPSSRQLELGIFQCTELPIANNPLLWHIHGTSLRKSSMVMGQLYYGKLLSEVTDRAGAVNKEYREAQLSMSAFRPKSWIDYFLVGDLYILGFSMDFFETDIWWLLSYKKSNFPDSKTVFYSRSTSEEKKLLLNCYNVECKHDDFMYVQFYKKKCSEIATEISAAREPALTHE